MSALAKNQFNWPIIGHQKIVSYLQKNIVAGKSSHAYLFVGPPQIGKTTLAKYFINSLLCQNAGGKEIVPCGECQSCRQIQGGTYADLIWLDREIDDKTDKLKKNISIEQIRDLQNRLSLRSFLDSYKIAVVSAVESLSQSAFNALLKTLEEPSPKTVLILLASDTTFIPLTILSRCQILKFLPVSDQEIFDYLLAQKVDRHKAKILSVLAYGRPGLAINYLENSDFYEENQQKVKDFFTLHRQDILERFKFASQISRLGASTLGEIFQIWKKILRDVFLLKNARNDLVVHVNHLKSLENLANLYQFKKLQNMFKEIDLAQVYLQQNVNPSLILENLILNLPAS